MTYVNEHSVLAIGILFIVLGFLAVGSRFFIGWTRNNGFAIDDWLSLLALVFVVTDGVIMIIGASTHTVGSHSPDNLGPGIATYDGWSQILLERLEFPFDIIQILALASLKLSILFFYRRIFIFGPSGVFNIVNWALICTVIAWAISFIIAILAACGGQIGANFGTLGDLKSKCVDTFEILICLAVTDVVVDLAVLLTPIPMVMALKMPMRRKICVLCILLVGTISIACGVTRMALFAEIMGPALFSHAKVGGVSSSDDSGIVSILMFWGMLEIGVAMVACCLPFFRPLVQDWSVESLFDSLRSVWTLHSRASREGSFRSRKKSAEGASESGDSDVLRASPVTKIEPVTIATIASADIEAFGIGKVNGSRFTEVTAEQDGHIWTATELSQHFEGSPTGASLSPTSPSYGVNPPSPSYDTSPMAPNYIAEKVEMSG